MNLVEHLKRQIAWSRATFGPGARTKGVIDHIRKELVEVENAPDYRNAVDAGSTRMEEWADVAILALDGLTRQLVHCGWNVDDAAEKAAQLILHKQGRNELRDWPDWRTQSQDHAIEHDRSKEAAA